MTNLALGLLIALSAGPSGDDPLPSWNEGPTKTAVLEFVQRTTEPGSPEFVAPADRIAVFDNDGTLWSERPVYFQLQFAVDRLRKTAADHPEWKDDPLFAPVLNSKPGSPDETAALAKIGKKGLPKLIAVSHAGMTTEEFDASVRDWLATARHPRFDRPYDELTFQPMLELLTLLRAHQYKTFIVSGGGVDFMRVFAERAYGVPPEQVVGSSGKTTYEERADGPVLVKEPAVNFVDDGPGKPVGIHQFIGRRPVAAFGNSDGDLQMLRWTDAGAGPRFCLLVHHTDADREWAYDRDSPIGRLDKALTDAADRGWTVVNMKRDWNRIYPPPASE